MQVRTKEGYLMDVDGPTCSVVAMYCGECPDSLSSVGKIVRDLMLAGF